MKVSFILLKMIEIESIEEKKLGHYISIEFFYISWLINAYRFWIRILFCCWMTHLWFLIHFLESLIWLNCNLFFSLKELIKKTKENMILLLDFTLLYWLARLKFIRCTTTCSSKWPKMFITRVTTKIAYYNTFPCIFLLIQYLFLNSFLADFDEISILRPFLEENWVNKKVKK